MKNILLTLGLLLSINSLFAQFSIGLSAGANYTFWNIHLASSDVSLGVMPALAGRAGLQGAYRFSPSAALRMELGTQIKGNKQEIEFTDVNGSLLTTGTVREYFQYYEGGLLVQLSPFAPNRNLYILAGANLGRMQKGWRIFSQEVVEDKINQRQAIDIDNSYYNRNVLSGDFGLGWTIGLSRRSHLQLEGRYQHAFTPFSKLENVKASANPFIFNLAYIFNI
jgi:hypothetical protein